MRPRSWLAEYAPFWMLGLFLLGYGVGLWQATRFERAIAQVKLEAAEKRQAVLAKVIANAFAKGKDLDHPRRAKDP